MPLGAAAPAVQIGLPMALALGLAYGLGPCLVSCLPYLGPVFLARDFGLRRSWQVVLPLSLGRLSVYAGLGGLAGLAGGVAQQAVTTANLRLLVGAAALLVGLALLWRPRTCPAGKAGETRVMRRLPREPRPLLPGGVFLMGVGMALTPCVPLSAVLVSASLGASAPFGLLLGLTFGLGAIVVPSLVYGIGAAYLGQRLRERLQGTLPFMERLAAGLLIFVGLSNLYP